MSLVLPWPPSVNHYWRRVGARTLLSRGGRLYKEAVAAVALSERVRPLAGRLSVAVELYPPDRRRRDIDNSLKAILDALKGHAFDDDSQIDRLSVERRGVIAGGYVLVEIGVVLDAEG